MIEGCVFDKNVRELGPLPSRLTGAFVEHSRSSNASFKFSINSPSSSLLHSNQPTAGTMAAAGYRKIVNARRMLRSHPDEWTLPLSDERDVALINADDLPFVDYKGMPYLRKVYHMKRGKDYETTDWTVESNEKLKEMVSQAGGQLIGYNQGPIAKVDWASVTVNVNIYYKPASMPKSSSSKKDPGSDWGFLSTAPKNIRIYRGSNKTCSDRTCADRTCPNHSMDIMILRDCTTNTAGSSQYVAERTWDILCIKCCDDFNCPWIVAAVRKVSDTRAESEPSPCCILPSDHTHSGV